MKFRVVQSCVSWRNANWMSRRCSREASLREQERQSTPGKPRHLSGENAISAAASGVKGAPFGLRRITLPAGNSLALPAKLPLPHPHMLADQPVQTWVTSVSLDSLQAPVADGGIGAELDDLDITEAWVYPEQGRALDKWARSCVRAAKLRSIPLTSR